MIKLTLLNWKWKGSVECLPIQFLRVGLLKNFRILNIKLFIELLAKKIVLNQYYHINENEVINLEN